MQFIDLKTQYSVLEKDIRAAIEKEFGPSFPTMTPTPKPPAATHDH